MPQSSNLKPLTPSYSEMYGKFDYNKTPILPPRLKLIIHEKSDEHKSWDPIRTAGWYLVPATNHYQCHCAFCTEIQS